MLLQFGALGVTMSWDDGFLGARASRPHKAWHSLGHLLHLDQTGTAPWLSCGLAAAVPAHRVAACSIALKLSGNQRNSMRAGRPRSQVIRDRMRAGRPRSQAITPPLRGSRRSRAARRRLMRWGVSGGRLLRKPTCTLWETPVCPRAGTPPCCADHSRKHGRSLMKTNHEWTRRDTKTGAPPSTTSGTRMLLQFCALGVTMSWDDGFPGARASRPHQAWHSLGHLPHLDQPGTAPWLSFGLAAAVPAHRVAACSIALKLSGGQRNSMRAGRPRSRVIRNRMRAGRPRSQVIRNSMRAGRPRSQALPPRRCGGGS